MTSNVLRELVPLETYLYAFGFANPFKPFSCSLNVWDHNGDVAVVAGVVVVCGVIVVIGVLVDCSFKIFVEVG